MEIIGTGAINVAEDLAQDLNLWAYLSAMQAIPGEGRRIAAALQSLTSRHPDNVQLSCWAYSEPWAPGRTYQARRLTAASEGGEFSAREVELAVWLRSIRPGDEDGIECTEDGSWIIMDAVVWTTRRDGEGRYGYRLPDHVAAAALGRLAWRHGQRLAIAQGAASIEVGNYLDVELPYDHELYGRLGAQHLADLVDQAEGTGDEMGIAHPSVLWGGAPAHRYERPEGWPLCYRPVTVPDLDADQPPHVTQDPEYCADRVGLPVGRPRYLHGRRAEIAARIAAAIVPEKRDETLAMLAACLDGQEEYLTTSRELAHAREMHQWAGQLGAIAAQVGHEDALADVLNAAENVLAHWRDAQPERHWPLADPEPLADWERQILDS